MISFLSIFSWFFKKENQKLVIFGTVIILMLVLFQTCNQNQKLKEQVELEKREQQRIKNNWEASLDTIRQYRDEQGTLVGEIQGYRLTQKELMSEYQDLFSSMQKFKKDWEKTPPQTIVEIHNNVVEKIKDFDVEIQQTGESGSIAFSSDTVFSPGNSRSIKGKLKYGISYFQKADSGLVKFSESSLYAKVNPFSPDLTIEQKINLTTGLSKDPKTGKIKIWATTNYPGLSFGEIKGAEIFDEKENRKLIGKPRKSWGIGFHIGPGIMYNMSNGNIAPGVSIGLGLNYSPKKLQF